MSSTSSAPWWILGGLAVLFIMKRRAPSAPAENLSAVTPSSAPGTWENSRPVDDTVAPGRDERTGLTNPLSAWLAETFGVRVPTIQPLMVTSNASAPNAANQIAPAAPAGSWEGSTLGMPAVPGTWTPSTSSEVPPGFVNLSDPNLMMISMPWGDDVIYVPDPVLGL